MLLSDSSCKIKELGQLKWQYLAFLFKPNPSLQSQHHLWSSSPETGWQRTKCWVKSPCKKCKESGWVRRHGHWVNTHCYTWGLVTERPRRLEGSARCGETTAWPCVCDAPFLSLYGSQLASQAALSSGESAMNHGQRVKDEGVWGRSTYPIPSYVQSSQWAGLVWTPSTKMHTKDGGQKVTSVNKTAKNADILYFWISHWSFSRRLRESGCA